MHADQLTVSLGTVRTLVDEQFPQRRLRNVVLRVLDRIPAVHRRMAMNLSELAVDTGI